MLLYKFEKRYPSDKLLVYNNPMEHTEPLGVLDKDVILSYYPETEMNDAYYIEEISTGAFILYDEKKLISTTCVESIVIPQCRRGLTVYDSSTDKRKEVAHISAGGRVYLTLDFNEDKQGNIWGRVCLLNESDFSDGYVVYKNIRNNFANVAITNTPITTVLTNGKIDTAKIDTVREENQMVSKRKGMSRSASNIHLSTGTTTLDAISDDEYFRILTGVKTLKNGKKKKIYSYKANKELAAYKKAVAQHAPSIAQNDKLWPPVIGVPTANNPEYSYDYTLNYRDGLDSLSTIHKLGNYDVSSIYANIDKNLKQYNRFKLSNPDDMLSRGYMHIFFTRPDCNLYKGLHKGLRDEVKNDPFIKYINLRNSGLLEQLILQNGSNHQFMMLLSNKAKGFQLTDDGINSDTHGKSMSGYHIAYGRRRDSELGGTMNINYTDTRGFDVLNLHKLWIDYIINVYKGKWTPKMTYIQNKILDYPVSVYVVVTAEDFETILFWTKYYGVFPVSIPFSSINWDGEHSTVSAPQLSVSYRYSWKEDLNPVALTELNLNAFKNNIPAKTKYMPIYDVRNGVINSTWVGAPFVEVIRYSNINANLTDGAQVTLKLRFRAK